MEVPEYGMAVVEGSESGSEEEHDSHQHDDDRVNPDPREALPSREEMNSIDYAVRRSPLFTVLLEDAAFARRFQEFVGFLDCKADHEGFDFAGQAFTNAETRERQLHLTLWNWIRSGFRAVGRGINRYAK